MGKIASFRPKQADIERYAILVGYDNANDLEPCTAFYDNEGRLCANVYADQIDQLPELIKMVQAKAKQVSKMT